MKEEKKNTLTYMRPTHLSVYNNFTKDVDHSKTFLTYEKNNFILFALPLQ